MGKEEETKEVKVEEKKEKKYAKIVEISTQTTPMIELDDGTVLDPLELQVLIYTKLCKIEKSVA